MDWTSGGILCGGGFHPAAADALYIHKNTLQYRLKRLEELTGCDVRRPSQAPVFYMAVLFFKEVEGSLLLMGS